MKTYGSAQCTGVKDQYFDQITKIREYSSGQLDRSVLRGNSTITLIYQFQNGIMPMAPFEKKITVLRLYLYLKILCALNTFLNQQL